MVENKGLSNIFLQKIVTRNNEKMLVLPHVVLNNPKKSNSMPHWQLFNETTESTGTWFLDHIVRSTENIGRQKREYLQMMY